jgi:hypothetical protein
VAAPPVVMANEDASPIAIALGGMALLTIINISTRKIPQERNLADSKDLSVTRNERSVAK